MDRQRKKAKNWCSKHQRVHIERKHKSCRYPNDKEQTMDRQKLESSLKYLQWKLDASVKNSPEYHNIVTAILLHQAVLDGKIGVLATSEEIRDLLLKELDKCDEGLLSIERISHALTGKVLQQKENTICPKCGHRIAYNNEPCFRCKEKVKPQGNIGREELIEIICQSNPSGSRYRCEIIANAILQKIGGVNDR